MKLVQLRYFVAVCKYGSFSTAARNMYVSQPAISQAIREFESEFNIRLFDRINNQLVLTDDGKWLYGKAEDLLRRAGEIAEELRARSVNKRCVRIGIAPMAGNSYFFDIINNMRNALPDMILDVHEAGSLEICRWLESGAVDIGLCILDGIDNDQMTTNKLVEAELKFCVHKSHPLANKQSLTFADIAQHNICMLREDSYQNVLIKRLFKQANEQIQVMMYSSQLNSIMTMLSYGNCGAFLFDGMVKDSSFVTVSMNPQIKLSLGIVWDSQQQETASVSQALKYIANHFKNKSI